MHDPFPSSAAILLIGNIIRSYDVSLFRGIPMCSFYPQNVSKFAVVDKRVDHSSKDVERERKSGADHSRSDGTDDEEENVTSGRESEQTREAHHRSRRQCGRLEGEKVEEG